MMMMMIVQAISTRFIQNLWVPDIYIYHMKGINRILTDFKGNPVSLVH